MIRVGITHGDINGIGYEVILKTFSDQRMTELCVPIIYGSSKVAAYHRKALDLPPVNINVVSRAEEAGLNRVNIINCVDDDIKVELTQSTPTAGRAAYKALEAAVADLKSGAIDVLVTAPINKYNIQNAQFHFPGHTEYLEQTLGDGQKALMILMTDTLRVALVTGHIPVSEIPSQITVDNIVTKLQVFNQSLKQDFTIIKPRIAVLALNPHAGDNGVIGNEEKEIIKPAMEEAERLGVMSFGPFPAETLNISGGLPFVRTSPAHGTAYNIAGQNIASESSFRQAVYTALDVYRSRKSYQEATAHPLRKQYFDKGSDNVKLDLTKDEDAEL